MRIATLPTMALAAALLAACQNAGSGWPERECRARGRVADTYAYDDCVTALRRVERNRAMDARGP